MCIKKTGRVIAAAGSAASALLVGAFLLACAGGLALVATVLQVSREHEPTTATVQGVAAAAVTLAVLGVIVVWRTLGRDADRAMGRQS